MPEVTIFSYIIGFVGLMLLAFAPGFLWSWVFWKKTSIDTFERLVFSIGISLAAVPTLIIGGNLVGVRITALTVTGEVLLLCLLAVSTLLIKKRKIS